jgi:2-hydroxy-3-keto-5-methylthiopentenyl-1-phosphate phosphatase
VCQLELGLAVLSDFDGTLVNIDTAEFVLSKFAKGDWRVFDEKLERGEISLEECMRSQFSMIRASKKEIIAELEKVTSIRPNFTNLVVYCRKNSIPVVVVSAGIDFCVRHFLELNGLQQLVEVHCANSRYTKSGIETTFPKLLHGESKNFKDDLVMTYKKDKGYKVAYIGDATGDYPAIKLADLRFSIKGSKLAERCRINNIPCKEITDFKEVTQTISESKTHL